MKMLIDMITEYPDIELDVSFQLNRLAYERMHASIDRCISNGMLACLFPEETNLKSNLPIAYHISNNELFNLDIASNAEQKTAVENIVNGTSGKAPYIVFGPPGTGKTITIVEAILQIKKRIKNARILVCAPANAACDMLTMKLIPHCSKKELIRVHSDIRDWKRIPNSVKPYSNYSTSTKKFTKPLGIELMGYSIVVCTLILSGRYDRGQQYFPDFVFIDEAAQAKEPEAIIPVAMLKPGKQLVLAGDPKQLGPMCSSTVAEKYHLGVSLLERLMDIPLYQSNDPNLITMLKLNFRAHPDVLQLPNDMFYDSQLIPRSEYAAKDPLANIFIYPKTLQQNQKGKSKAVTCGKAAVEFCSVIAKERREGLSPSYFNPTEVEMVLRYIETIISLQETKVLLSDIGVVTPYIRQVHRIKDRLQDAGYGEEIEVGTTEAFQGQEKRVIIISTVRAQHSLLLQDRRYKLGFIKNEKRFNVALTRAKSKLIIIGCPLVLRYDKKWLKLIDFCQDRNAYFGGKFDRRTDVEKTEIMNRVGSICLKDTQYNH